MPSHNITVKKAQNNKVYNSLIMLVLEGNSTVYVTGFAKRYLFHTFDIPANKIM